MWRKTRYYTKYSAYSISFSPLHFVLYLEKIDYLWDSVWYSTYLGQCGWEIWRSRGGKSITSNIQLSSQHLTLEKLDKIVSNFHQGDYKTQRRQDPYNCTGTPSIIEVPLQGSTPTVPPIKHGEK